MLLDLRMLLTSSCRGNSITGSRFEKLSSIFGKAHGEPSAIYLDDQLSSVNIQGNWFEGIEGRVMELGGGRHNTFVNNICKFGGAVQVKTI